MLVEGRVEVRGNKGNRVRQRNFSLNVGGAFRQYWELARPFYENLMTGKGLTDL